MTDRKPDGPFVIGRATSISWDVVDLRRPKDDPVLTFWFADFGEPDARRHAQDFADKLNREHAAGKDAK